MNSPQGILIFSQLYNKKNEMYISYFVHFIFYIPTQINEQV